MSLRKLWEGGREGEEEGREEEREGGREGRRGGREGGERRERYKKIKIWRDGGKN